MAPLLKMTRGFCGGDRKVSHVLSVLSRHSMKHKLGWHVVHLVRGSR